jgi:outer membrane protein assembly factor BamB
MRKWMVAASTVVFLAVGLVETGPSAATTAPIVPGHLPYPSGGTNAIGPGIDSNNQNAQLAESIGSRIKAGWHARPPLCPSAAGSDATSISVAGSRTVVLDRQYQCSWLSAYDTATGKLYWRRQYHFALNAKINGSTVYVLHDTADDADLVDAIDLATGTLKWTQYDGGYNGPYGMTIGSGLLMSAFWAADVATGAHRFTVAEAPAASTDGIAFIAGGRIFNNSASAVQAYSVTSGALLWSYRKQPYSGPAAGNAAPSLHNGLLYVPTNFGTASSTTLVLNPATGARVRILPRSDLPIAFDGEVGIFTVTDYNKPSVLSAVNLTTGAVYWTHRLPANDTHPTVMAAPPVIENGLVWILDGVDTGTPGHVAALDEITGATRSILVQSCPVAFNSSLIIAQHRIFASSNCGVLIFTAA